MKSDQQPDKGRAPTPKRGQRDRSLPRARDFPALRRFFVPCYQELLRFLEERRDRMRRLAADGPDDQQQALQLSELEPMEQLIVQLQERL